jgi:hypothetical protein
MKVNFTVPMAVDFLVATHFKEIYAAIMLPKLLPHCTSISISTLHQGFTVLPWCSDDFNKTNYHPKKAMLYNIKNLNLANTTDQKRIRIAFNHIATEREAKTKPYG